MTNKQTKKPWEKSKKPADKVAKEVIEERPVYSTNNPEAKVSEIPSMSFQRNKYERDIFQAAAKEMGLSMNAYLRQAGLEKAAKLKIY